MSMMRADPNCKMETGLEENSNANLGEESTGLGFCKDERKQRLALWRTYFLMKQTPREIVIDYSNYILDGRKPNRIVMDFLIIYEQMVVNLLKGYLYKPPVSDDQLVHMMNIYMKSPVKYKDYFEDENNPQHDF
ncbi:MAG: hypothetical protein KJN67_05540 [Pontiella sp.]|nr:hypothetical protein [Pontiella sp.]